MNLHRTLWDVHGTLLFDGTDTVPGLGVDVQRIAANALAVATFDYFTTDPAITSATWTVNGLAKAPVPLTNGAATLRVTSATVGKITVSCNAEPQLTIQAV
jgi:hypothetical protein